MTPSSAGSSPAIPATSSGQSPLCSEHPAGIPRSAPLPLLSKRDPLRSRWRLCRLTDAAYPLRVLRWARVWEPPAAALKTLSCNYTFDPLAQPVEQLPFKPWVRGSNPRRVTTSEQSPLCSGIFFAKNAIRRAGLRFGSSRQASYRRGNFFKSQGARNPDYGARKISEHFS